MIKIKITIERDKKIIDGQLFPKVFYENLFIR